MIYVVTQQILPESDKFTIISPQAALHLLEPLRKVGLDTETKGFDPYTKDLIMVQLGCFEFQVVIDVTTVSLQFFKKYLESDRLFIGWNIKFDLKFLLHQRIIVKECYDGFVCEKLLWLGFPPGMHRMSLKAAGNNYLNIDLDKTVRGKVMTSDLSEEIIEYGAFDVKYLEKIKDCQEELLKARGLYTSSIYENKSINWLAYTEYCGVTLDVEKWRYKMLLDNSTVKIFEQALTDWVERSVAGEKTAYHYLETSKITKQKDLDKARSKMGGIRCPEKDIKPPIRGYYEAYEVPIEKRLSDSHLTLNQQGDLWSGFDTVPRCKINWNSSDQVALIFKELGFNIRVPDSETGEMKDSLEAGVIEPQKHLSTFAYLYLKYKGATKVTSTYGQNVIDLINPVTKRLHTNFNQLGADTGRLSSGGKDKANNLKYLNFQNFPADAETRACFVPQKGYKWKSYDYSGQESRIIADITNDQAMIDLFNIGCGDIHSLVAKMTYPSIIGNTPIEEIKAKFPKLRNDVKSQVEFPINYGGDWNTVRDKSGKTEEEAKELYNNYMAGFKGIKAYQDRQRAFVMKHGYIILNEKTQQKAYVYDFPLLKRIEKRFCYEFWMERNPYKGKGNPYLPNAVKMQINNRFAQGEPLKDMVGTYTYEKKSGKKVIIKSANVKLADVYNVPVQYYFRRKSSVEKQSINYP